MREAIAYAMGASGTTRLIGFEAPQPRPVTGVQNDRFHFTH